MGCTPDLQAHAFLLVELSMFQLQKSAKKKQRMKEFDDSSSSDGSDGSNDETYPTLSWKKAIDLVMQQWIESTGCHRNFSDKYFNNPSA